MKHYRTVHRIRALSRAVTALALVTGAVTVGSFMAPAQLASAATTLVVEANAPFRPVTHVATGSLYGLATGTVPADNLVEAIKPNTFVQMAVGGHQQAEGDVLVVAPEAAKAGARLVDRMSDYYAGWPYEFSWSTWPTVVQNQVQDGPELLRQHQRYAEFPAERGRDRHRAEHHHLARAGELRQDRG